MATGSKTVKYQGSFAVFDAANTASPNKAIKDLTLTVGQVQSSDPMCIPGSSVDFVVPFGAITTAKRIYIKTDQEVTLKVQQNTDVGFPWQGEGVLSSGTGIVGLWITTGPNDTNVEIVVAGD
jgi:hypothetical protein